MRAHIQQELLRKLPAGPVDIRDTKLTGFVLRVRPSGTHTYYAAWTAPGKPGQPRKGRTRWKVVGTTATHGPHEARAEARKILGQTYNGADPVLAAKADTRAARARMTFRTFVADHFPGLTTAATADQEATRLRKAYGTAFDDLPLDAITEAAVVAWRAGRLKAGKAAATVNRDLNTLRAALRLAVVAGILPADPLPKVKRLRVDESGRVRYLTADEDTRLRAALAAREATRRAQRARANLWRAERGYRLWPAFHGYTDHLTPLVLLALNTGCRRGELFNLRWHDVDLERKILTVEGQTAKSGQTRHIPLNSAAVNVLTTWKPNDASPDDVVFPGADGAPLTDVKGAWLALMKAAGVTAFRFHDTRHTFASNLVMAGIDLNVVRELLGHSNPQMTLKYAHLSPGHKAAAVEKLVTS